MSLATAIAVAWVLYHVFDDRLVTYICYFFDLLHAELERLHLLYLIIVRQRLATRHLMYGLYLLVDYFELLVELFLLKLMVLNYLLPEDHLDLLIVQVFTAGATN